MYYTSPVGLAAYKTNSGYIIQAPAVDDNSVVAVIELTLDKKFVFTDWLKLTAVTTKKTVHQGAV